RGCVHTKANLFRMPAIDQQGDTAASLGDGLVHFLRLPVSSASLNVAMKKMMGYGVEHSSWRLRACGIIKEDKFIPQSGKRSANLAYWELNHDPNKKPVLPTIDGTKPHKDLRKAQDGKGNLRVTGNNSTCKQNRDL